MPDQLKAYTVRDSDEGYCRVVFDTNGAAARRNGASELGCEFEDIESCCRSPEFDQYAPGPVPALTLIAHGWWWECSYCGRRVSNDMADDLEDEDLDPGDFVPRENGHGVLYCSDICECRDHMERAGKEEACDALRELFEAKFKGAEIVSIHCGDGPLLTADSSHCVYFTFPGGTRAAKWCFGGDHCSVSLCDAEAFKAWQSPPPVTTDVELEIV